MLKPCRYSSLLPVFSNIQGVSRRGSIRCLWRSIYGEILKFCGPKYWEVLNSMKIIVTLVSGVDSNFII